MITTKNTLIVCLVATIMGSVIAATEPDYGKEERWIEQIEDSIMDGDMLMIAGADAEFAAILTESETDSNKAAVVVHGLGVHPDWAGVINPLRVSLTTKGYTTLSIQMPVLANGIEGKEYMGLLPISAQRLAVAADYLEKEGYEVDLIVAHSLGTTMVSHYLATTPNPFDKYVAVGANFGSVNYLPEISIPLFDLYATEDIDGVMNSREARQKASKHNAGYTLASAEGNHFFTDKDQNLIDAVHAWLDTQK